MKILKKSSWIIHKPTDLCMENPHTANWEYIVYSSSLICQIHSLVWSGHWVHIFIIAGTELCTFCPEIGTMFRGIIDNHNRCLSTLHVTFQTCRERQISNMFPTICGIIDKLPQEFLNVNNVKKRLVNSYNIFWMVMTGFVSYKQCCWNCQVIVS